MIGTAPRPYDRASRPLTELQARAFKALRRPMSTQEVADAIGKDRGSADTILHALWSKDLVVKRRGGRVVWERNTE